VTVLLGTVIELDLNAKVITSEVGSVQSFTGYDTLVLAAGAMTSYCGHDEYAGFAPGMKSIDDALELRGRILGAFELVERATDPVEQERLLTFAIVGGDPTGVELAGQVSERRPGRDPRWPVMRPRSGPGLTAGRLRAGREQRTRRHRFATSTRAAWPRSHGPVRWSRSASCGSAVGWPG